MRKLHAQVVLALLRKSMRSGIGPCGGIHNRSRRLPVMVVSEDDKDLDRPAPRKWVVNPFDCADTRDD